MQNNTIEERVALLEIQVVEIQEDVSGLDEDITAFGVDLTELEGDVNFLFAETIIQDERIFTLEQTSIETTVDVESNYLFIFHVSCHFYLNQSSAYILLNRFRRHNSCLRFPSDSFGGERRGWWEQLCSWIRSEGGNTWRNSCWSRDKDFCNWVRCDW